MAAHRHDGHKVGICGAIAMAIVPFVDAGAPGAEPPDGAESDWISGCSYVYNNEAKCISEVKFSGRAKHTDCNTIRK